MSPIEAALLVAALALPFHLAVLWQLSRLSDPRHIRASGVVIRREEILEHGEVIGRYAGRDIYRTVHFMGMEYRFDRVARPSYRDYISARELFLEPGLVYVTD
jgi:hypothetical protein